MTIKRSHITGCGAYLPERCVTNSELAAALDTTDEWIQSRTGIRQRHIAADGELTSDLATNAARKALDAAGLTADDIDLVVVATATPDLTFPATATQVQANLGVTRGCAFDVQAVCTGFVYALTIADNFVQLGQSRGALVIGAETFSRILDWNDRGTCVLFGDGAGAVVLQPGEGAGTVEDRGILSTHLHADGRYKDMLYVDGGPSTTQLAGFLRMEGKEVFKHAVVNLAQAVDEALEANGVDGAAVDWLVPHQANRRIIDATARKLGVTSDKVVVTIDR
ncbi:MAG: ketoacyl-ACP synthase III, partial [Rhodospirillaceae bacterium]|nr:ketoacyl-ACP synthase III [Rhodospirillaceae bacterium]